MGEVTTIAGRKVEAKNEQADCLNLLRETIARIEAGEQPTTHILLVTMDQSNVDTFSYATDYCGRAGDHFLSLELARGQLLVDMGLD